MTASPDKQTDELRAGDQVAAIYESMAEDLLVLAPFLKNGLQRGEKCICMAESPLIEELIAALNSLEVDTDQSIRSGDLVFASMYSVKQLVGEQTPKSMLDLIEKANKDAIQEGRSGLRFSCAMNWMLADSRPHESLVEFGRLLATFLSNSSTIVLSRYRLAEFDLALIGVVLRTSPLIYLNAVACPNHYFEPPELWLLPTPQEIQEVKRSLAKLWIARLKEARRMHQIGQLAGGIAHEINNQLSIVIGYSDLLLLQLPDVGPSRDMLFEIRDAGRASAALTKLLLKKE